MKKKVLATVLATAMVAASLVGCGGSSNETGGDSTPAADDSAAATDDSSAADSSAADSSDAAADNGDAAAKPLNMVPARSRSGWLRTLLTLQMRKQQNSLQQILIWQVIRLPLNL